MIRVHQLIVILASSFASGMFMNYFIAYHIDNEYWQLGTVLFIYWIARVSLTIENFIETYDR